MPDASPTKRAPRGLIAAAAAAVLAVGGWFGAGAYGSSLVRERLEKMTTAAGLQLEVESIRVSPLGSVRIDGLAFKRGDGSAVIAVAEIAGTLSPTRALAGARRPESLEVTGLKVDVRVVDGKPQELLDLYKAARSKPKDPAKTPKKRPASARTSLVVNGGEVALTVVGKGADLLPKGLAIKGLRVNFDPAANVGEVSAQVHGTQTSTLSAKLHPAQGDRPAHIEAALSPQLRVNLPTDSPLARFVDAVVVRGFGYDGALGPSIDGVELHRGKTRLLDIAHVATDDATLLGVKLSGVAFHVPGDLLGAVLSRGQARAGGPRVAQAPARPSAATSKRTASSKRRASARKRSNRNTKRKRKRRSAKKSKSSTGAKKGQAAPQPAVARSRQKPEKPGSPRKWPDLVGKVESVSAGSNDLLFGKKLQASASKLELALPGGVGTAGFEHVQASVERDKDGGSLASALRSITLEQPFVDVTFRQESLAKLPGGDKLHALVLRARRGPVAQRLAEQEDGDDEEDKGLPPEAVKPRKKRRKGPRQPFTQSLIRPARKLLRQLAGAPDLVDVAIAQLDRLPQLEIKVKGGRAGLKDPVADKAFGGIKDAELTLTRRLSDKTRGMQASASPFAADAVLGTMSLDLTTGTNGKLDRLELAVDGPSFARMVAAIGASASVKDDAKLTVKATLRRGEKGGLLLKTSLATHHIGINWWRLAPRPIDDFAVQAEAVLTATENPPLLRLQADKLQFGQAKAALLFEVRDFGPEKATAQLKFGLPEQDCAEVASSIPPSMAPTIGRIEAEGTIALDFDLTLPLHKPYKGKLEATLADDACAVKQFGELDVTELARPFSRPVNESGTILEDQLIGPKSDAWVDLQTLPAWVPYAMIATEDAAFYHHRGVRLGLLSRAIKMCLDHGRFVYGGSTITQQLIKNIYLTRDKNLARKFEELLIVWHIERSLVDGRKDIAEEDRFVATKDRLLELYINGIEFGPKLYGITRASREYFGKEPAALSPLESAFLAANKPCPKCGHKRFTTQKWTPWWQERMVSIMSKMRRDGIISDDDFAAEAPYVPRFAGWPNSEREAPGSKIGGVEE